MKTLTSIILIYGNYLSITIHLYPLFVDSYEDAHPSFEHFHLLSTGLLPLSEKRSRRDQIFIESNTTTDTSSVGATYEHAAPTELNAIDGVAGYKHSTPTEPEAKDKYYRVIGQPEDLEGAKELAEKAKDQGTFSFQG